LISHFSYDTPDVANMRAGKRSSARIAFATSSTIDSGLVAAAAESVGFIWVTTRQGTVRRARRAFAPVGSQN
jgi:hypothetical protein